MKGDSIGLVLITGCTGFVGSWCVKKATEAGFRVRGTTRRINSERAKQLKVLFPNLELAVTELLSDDGWEEAFQDVDFLLHVASPYFYKGFDSVKPAVEGTERVLNFALKFGVKKIVVTSSNAAISEGFKAKDIPALFTEENYSKVENLDPNGYFASKTLAEKKAWEIAKENELCLTTVNPSAIWGPMIIKGPSAGSTELAQMMMNGKLIDIPVAHCDVRDVAELHVTALTNAETNGRRLFCISGSPSMSACADIIDDEFGQYGLTKTQKIPNCLVCCLVNFCCCCSPISWNLCQKLGKEYEYDSAFAESLLKNKEFNDREDSINSYVWDALKYGLIHSNGNEKLDAKIKEMRERDGLDTY